MKDSNLLRLGGAAAILLGIVNGLSSVLYFVLPPEQRAAQPAATILPSVAQDATVLILLFWTQALVGILGMAVVPAVSRLVRDVHEGWVRWTANLATFGFGVSAAGYFLDIARLQNIAQAFVAGDATTKAVLKALWKSSLDQQGFWGYGAVGAWVLVISLLAMRSALLPRTLSYVGVVLSILYLLTPPAAIVKSQELLLLIVGGAAVLTPVWYIWTGLVARRAATAQSAPAADLSATYAH